LQNGRFGYSSSTASKTVSSIALLANKSFSTELFFARKAITVEKDIPLEVDAGFLTVTDPNPIDAESYVCVLFFCYFFSHCNSALLTVCMSTHSENLEDYLINTARDGVQTIIASLFSLPVTSSDDGPVAQLPAPTTMLPRAKPLPKPKPPTKWEQFAKAKGISHRTKEKKVWDEDKQDWVDRWGWKGANKDKEVQWLTEVPKNAGALTLLLSFSSSPCRTCA
jgi:regulator of ribosome biosynthesis